MRVEPWREAFAAAGVAPDFYLRERRLEELLPWDHVDCGVSRDFLLTERARADQGLETPDCRRAGCQDCGVCDQDRISLRLEDPLALPLAPPPTPDPGPPSPCRYRLTYAKLEESRWLGHLEMVTSLYRSLRRSGLPLSFSAGFHPLPRVSFYDALPLGVESLAETMDVELATPVPEEVHGTPQLLRTPLGSCLSPRCWPWPPRRAGWRPASTRWSACLRWLRTHPPPRPPA